MGPFTQPDVQPPGSGNGGAVVVKLNPPRGVFSAKLDDRIRLKLPADCKNFFYLQRIRQFYGTTLDLKTGLLFPPDEWLRTENALNNFEPDREAGEDTAFIARHYGGDVDMDDAGRVVLPERLRELLQLEKGQTVWIEYSKGRFKIYTDAAYQERLAKALNGREERVSLLAKHGIL